MFRYKAETWLGGYSFLEAHATAEFKAHIAPASSRLHHILVQEEDGEFDVQLLDASSTLAIPEEEFETTKERQVICATVRGMICKLLLASSYSCCTEFIWLDNGCYPFITELLQDMGATTRDPDKEGQRRKWALSKASLTTTTYLPSAATDCWARAKSRLFDTLSGAKDYLGRLLLLQRPWSSSDGGRRKEEEAYCQQQQQQAAQRKAVAAAHRKAVAAAQRKAVAAAAKRKRRRWRRLIKRQKQAVSTQREANARCIVDPAKRWRYAHQRHKDYIRHQKSMLLVDSTRTAVTKHLARHTIRSIGTC